MFIGQRILTKKDGQIIECSIVQFIGQEDLELTDDISTFIRKYWEVRKIEIKNEEKE